MFKEGEFFRLLKRVIINRRKDNTFVYKSYLYIYMIRLGNVGVRINMHILLKLYRLYTFVGCTYSVKMSLHIQPYISNQYISPNFIQAVESISSVL